MSTLNEPVAKRIGKLVRMFGSSFENWRHVALLKLKTLLDEERLTFSDIAVVIENANGEIEQLKYSDSDAELIFAKGVEKGRAERNGTAPSAQYLDEDGEPRWIEIAEFCAKSPAKITLKPNEQDVIDKAPFRLQQYGSMTWPTEGFLLSIFWKLGGSFK